MAVHRAEATRTEAAKMRDRAKKRRTVSEEESRVVRLCDAGDAFAARFSVQHLLYAVVNVQRTRVQSVRVCVAPAVGMLLHT